MHIFAKKIIPSDINGPIVVRHVGPRTNVTVDGFEQGSAYVAELWKRALWHVPETHPVKHILVLGLGSGSSLETIRRRYPNAHVTAVEWDPAMVNIAKSLRSYPADHAPEIILGDAIEIVPKMRQSFDLILVDLFTGGTPEPRLASQEMVDALARVLASDGYLILNLLKNVAAIPALERTLARHAAWPFKRHTLALFRHYGQGRVGDPVPRGFIHPMQSVDYLYGGWEPGAQNVELVGKPGCYGMRWHYGPVWIEGYTSDVQPEIDQTAHARLVIWQPIVRTSRPAGWHRSWIQMNPQQHGFADIEGKPEYWKEWTDHAQRHRKKWLKDDRFDIAEVSLDDFADAYNKTGKLPMMRKDFIRLLTRRIARQGDNVHLFAAREKATGRLIAGLGVCDLPDTSDSMHLVAFIHPKYEKTSVGTGLIDHWYRHCQDAGIRFPHFGLVWAPGDPGSWKGYSKFKRQFNLHLLLYPRPLIRFVRRKK